MHAFLAREVYDCEQWALAGVVRIFTVMRFLKRSIMRVRLRFFALDCGALIVFGLQLYHRKVWVSVE